MKFGEARWGEIEMWWVCEEKSRVLEEMRRVSYQGFGLHFFEFFFYSPGKWGTFWENKGEKVGRMKEKAKKDILVLQERRR